MKTHLATTFALLILYSLIAASGAACRRAPDQSNNTVQIELVAPVSPPPVGLCPLELHITDASGAPLEDLQVSVRGDMTHAGMIPVLATAEPVGDGLYRALMDWTMAGDWVITVEATLPEGSRATRQIDFDISTDGSPCEESD